MYSSFILPGGSGDRALHSRLLHPCMHPTLDRMPSEEAEIYNVLPILLHHLGLHGPVEKLTDYWQAASLFELNFLVGRYELACKAAFKMQALWGEDWMIRTTYKNINMIKAVPRRENDVRHLPQYIIIYIYSCKYDINRCRY